MIVFLGLITLLLTIILFQSYRINRLEQQKVTEIEKSLIKIKSNNQRALRNKN